MGRYENNIRRNMEDLMNAVVMQAVEDYREAYLKLMRGENDQARKMLMKTEAFFQSEDFSCYTTVDGPRLLSRLKKEREEVEAMIRELQACRKRLAAAWQAFCLTDKQDPLLYEAIWNTGEKIRRIMQKLPRFAANRFNLSWRERNVLAVSTRLMKRFGKLPQKGAEDDSKGIS